MREGAGLLGRYTAEQPEVLIDYTRRDRALQEQHAARIRSLSTVEAQALPTRCSPRVRTGDDKHH